jgi:hypothetical protein
VLEKLNTDNESARGLLHLDLPFWLAGEATTAAKTFIKPCAVEMETCVFGEQSNKKLVSVHSFNNTVKRSI